MCIRDRPPHGRVQVPAPKQASLCHAGGDRHGNFSARHSDLFGAAQTGGKLIHGKKISEAAASGPKTAAFARQANEINLVLKFIID